MMMDWNIGGSNSSSHSNNGDGGGDRNNKTDSNSKKQSPSMIDNTDHFLFEDDFHLSSSSITPSLASWSDDHQNNNSSNNSNNLSLMMDETASVLFQNQNGDGGGGGGGTNTRMGSSNNNNDPNSSNSIDNEHHRQQSSARTSMPTPSVPSSSLSSSSTTMATSLPEEQNVVAGDAETTTFSTTATTAVIDCVGIPTVDNPPQIPNDGVADSIIAQQMAKLSMEERERVYYDVHGVRDPPIETPQLIQDSIHRLVDVELPKLCKRTRKNNNKQNAYERAVEQNPNYVHNPDFLLRFLRAELFVTSKAAVRIVRHFETKCELFGPTKLTQDITQDEDLDQEDIQCLYGGQSMVLPIRDRAGRAIAIWTAVGPQISPPINKLRRQFYLAQIMSEDVETQRRGVVVIYISNGKQGRAKFDRTYAWKAAVCSRSTPVRIEAFHFSLDSTKSGYKPMFDIIKIAMNPFSRVRIKTHFGSYSECVFSLQTYGIPAQDFPLTEEQQEENPTTTTTTTRKFTLHTEANTLMLRKRREVERRARTSWRVGTQQTTTTNTAVGGSGIDGGTSTTLASGSTTTTTTTAATTSFPTTNVSITDGTADGMEKVHTATNTAKTINSGSGGSGSVNSGSHHRQQKQKQQQKQRRQQQQQPRSCSNDATPSSSTGASAVAITSKPIMSCTTIMPEIVGVPSKKDVLFGRGKSIQCHLGNVRYRQLVEESYGLYERSRKDQKTQIAQQIIEIIHTNGGRFLRDDPGIGWTRVTEANVLRKKVAHAFRGLRSLKESQLQQSKQQQQQQPPPTPKRHLPTPKTTVSSSSSPEMPLEQEQHQGRLEDDRRPSSIHESTNILVANNKKARRVDAY